VYIKKQNQTNKPKSQGTEKYRSMAI